MNATAKRATLTCALLATTGLCTPAFAQQTVSAPPAFRTIDENGVDLVRGAFDLALEMGSVGAGEGSLALVEHVDGSWHNLQIRFRRTESGSEATIELIFGDRTETFKGALNATSFTPVLGNGATLTKVSAEEYRYVSADGTEVHYAWPSNLIYLGGNTGFCAAGYQSGCALVARTLKEPSGNILTYTWRAGDNCTPRTLSNGEIVYDCAHFYRLSSVANSFNNKVTFSYVNDTDPTTGLPDEDWHKRNGASFSSAGTGVGTASYAFPTTAATDYTDVAGRTWRVTRDSNRYITGVRRPGSSANNISVSRDANGAVSQVVKDGVTTKYARVVSGSTATMTATDALNGQSVVTSDLTIGRPTSVKNQLGHTTSVAYDVNARPTRITAPEGNYVEHTYDARGNVTTTTLVGKSGSGVPNIVTSASYDTTCTYKPKCNKPNSTTDARGKVTNYTYNTTHGGIETITAPAAPSGVRPQTRYSYTAVTAVTSQPVTMLTGISACQTQASCAGTSDEVKSTIRYDTVNIKPTSVTSGNGTGSVSATSAFSYDAVGNLLTVDGPLATAADTVRFRYDAARQRVGSVSADPDGTGALKHRAQRITYRPDGQVSKVETGTVASQSDADWSTMGVSEAVNITFDGNNRPVRQNLVAGGSTRAVTQLSYDAVGRPDCTAVRMNLGVFGSLPTSACTLGTEGSFGPDRITRTIYDAAGRVTKQQTGVGTTGVRDEVTGSYSNNGKLKTVTDAENNKTSYEYDGHDRLSKTFYPSATKGSGTSSTTDYEQLTYESLATGTRTSGLVTSRRLRDAQVIGYGYDNLSRLTSKNLPGTELDVSYGHDLLGRATSASQSGHSLSFTYDALGRNLTQAGPQGTVSAVYDAAGRRTKLTYPGSGLYLNYDYLVTGETTKIRENGATTGVGVLATFGYDDSGRRTSLTRGNGTVTSYSYDAVSRLSQLVQDVGGAATTHDLTLGFSYNPASQIEQNTRSNDVYAFGAGNVSTSYAANGRNQYTSVGGVATAHDARGNMTDDGPKTYGYSSENLLTTVSGANIAAYDPVLRLYQVTGSPTTRFAYDGADMIAEYDPNNALLRRHVHGPGVDEPLVTYEGSGTTTRKFLHADERGSIVAVSDGTGAVTNVNTYDEYGQPGSGNVGRFQYTGQKWIGEIGLYDYKARMYHPRLGRFMQTDPIGYDDGMNLYAYVGNDPVNFVDPLGLVGEAIEIVVIGRRQADGPGRGGARGFGFGGLPSVGGQGGNSEPAASPEIVVTCNRACRERNRRRSSPPPRSHPAPALLLSAMVAAPDKVRRQDWCGSSGTSSVPDSPGGYDVSLACRTHDQCYSSNSSADRYTCDLGLLVDVYNQCRATSGPNQQCAIIATFYFLGVRAGGWFAYQGEGRSR